MCLRVCRKRQGKFKAILLADGQSVLNIRLYSCYCCALLSIGNSRLCFSLRFAGTNLLLQLFVRPERPHEVCPKKIDLRKFPKYLSQKDFL